MSEQKKTENANDLMRVQGAHGNWDYDPYMHGMYNGMELILAIFEEREPVFREAPSEWRRDRLDLNEKPVAEDQPNPPSHTAPHEALESSEGESA